MTDSLDTIASAFAQRGYIVALKYTTSKVYVAVQTDEAKNPEQAVFVALKRATLGSYSPLLDGTTPFFEALGPMTDAPRVYTDTDENRNLLGLIPPPEVEIDYGTSWYDGEAFGQRRATNCHDCGELLAKHEAGRGDTCDSCRIEERLRQRPKRAA